MKVTLSGNVILGEGLAKIGTAPNCFRNLCAMPFGEAWLLDPVLIEPVVPLEDRNNLFQRHMKSSC